jgi:hypothetical protein
MRALGFWLLAVLLGAGAVRVASADPPSCGSTLVSRCYCDLPGGKYTMKAKVNQGNGTGTYMSGGIYGTSGGRGGGVGGTNVLVTNIVANANSVVTVYVTGANCKTVVTSFSANTQGLQECTYCP